MDLAPLAATPGRSKRLQGIAGGLIILFGLYFTNQDVFSRAFPSEPVGEDGISNLEARLAPVLAATPPDGIFGFITDGDLPDDMGIKRFYVVQYSLVPRLITADLHAPLVVGVFDKPYDVPLRQHHLRVVRDFGRGVLLLKADR